MQTLETPEVKKIQKNIEKEKVGIIRIIDYTSRGDSLETNLELLLDDENRFPVKFNGYVGEILIGKKATYQEIHIEEKEIIPKEHGHHTHFWNNTQKIIPEDKNLPTYISSVGHKEICYSDKDYW